MLALLFATMLAARDAAAQGSHGPHEFTAPIMGVDVRIVIHGGPHEEAAASAEAAFERVRALNRIFSDYEPASEAMRLAAHAGDGTFVPVSPDLARLLLAGRSLSNASGGAFDLTVLPLSRLYRAARREGRLPDAEAVARARALVGQGVLELAPHRRARLRLRGSGLDFGGIAKGYAMDEALDVLVRRGQYCCLVQADGDLVLGLPPEGRPGFVLEITDLPVPEAMGTVEVPGGCAMSTSGDAHQALEAASARHAHITDPRTGRARTGSRFAVVVAPTGLEADAVATTLCALERGEIDAFLAQFVPGVEALYGDAAGIWDRTPGFPEIRRSPR